MKFVFPGALAAMAALLLASAASGAERGPALAELPRLHVDTTTVSPHGRTLAVRAGGDFQAALDAARPGDVITLAAGATFAGPFTLPAKAGGAGWIVVRSSAPVGAATSPSGCGSRADRPPAHAPRALPPAGCRVDPSYAELMPKLVARSAPVLAAAPGAHHFRFIGIEIHPGGTDAPSAWQALRSARNWLGGARGAAVSASDQTLVMLGAKEKSVDALPHHIVFDRCYVHGDRRAGARRGVAMNSRDTAVVDSYLSDFKAVGVDAQAIAGWNGSGPFKIDNNYLEGSGENLMFGGADPSIPGLVPSDIEIRGNEFAKPRAWRIGDTGYGGTLWTVKNLLELKNARRVLIDGNLFEYSWHQAQTGFALLFTVRNQDGGAPWSVVHDVTFSNNRLRHVGGGIDILGHDNNHASGQVRRVLIRNNLFEDVGPPWGRGQLFQVRDGTADVVIEHNTAIHADNIVQGGDHRAHTGFVFTDNIVMHNAYGIIGSGTGVGHPSLARYFPNAVVRRNVIIGGSAREYPPDNFFPETPDQVGFVDAAGGDYRLRRSSPYRCRGTDGTDIGVDTVALAAAAANRSIIDLRGD